MLVGVIWLACDDILVFLIELWDFDVTLFYDKQEVDAIERMRCWDDCPDVTRVDEDDIVWSGEPPALRMHATDDDVASPEAPVRLSKLESLIEWLSLVALFDEVVRLCKDAVDFEYDLFNMCGFVVIFL